MGYTIQISRTYLGRFRKTHQGKEPECSKCGLNLSSEKEVYKSKNSIYCLSCEKLVWFDSKFELSDKELENFFKIV